MDDPYPHLGSVPARPSGTDAAGRARIAGGLVTDRSNAQYASQLTPLTAAPAVIRAARPVQPTPGPDTDDSTASLTAASAPPAAPLPKEQSAQPPAPATPAVAAASPPSAQARPAEPISQLPGMAASPPPPPLLPGVARVTIASPPPPRPPARPPVLAPAAPGEPLSIPFAADRAILPEGASQALKVLYGRPGVSRIVVAGYGDAGDADPDIQAAALPLALARAQAIRTALRRIGVPDSAIQMTAEAVGHGGVARAE